MYTYIKKALLVICLLALPFMNAGVMAMEKDLEENEHASIAYCQKLTEGEQTNEVCEIVQSRSSLNVTAYKGLIMGIFFLTCFITPLEAAGCYCTCAGYANQQECTYIGPTTDNTTCRTLCAYKNFHRGSICIY